MVKRKAIAMIELIIAIVIMGIAFLAIPMINNEAIKSDENAMLQESIAAGASQTELILTMKWDENSSDILDTSTSWDGLSGATASRKVNDDGKTASVIGHDVATNDDFNDMDDYNSESVTLNIYNAEGFETYEGNYADTSITMATTVQYADDTIATFSTATTMNGINPFNAGTPAGTSNIKLITTTLTTTEDNASDTINNKEIKLQTFSCNVGRAPIQRTTNDN
ncbi:MAG: hypothetical protein P8Y43_05650 [Sulfurovaceae bacterium]